MLLEPLAPSATDLEVLMLGEEAGEVDGLVGAPLRDHHHTPDLLHLGVVWGTHTIQVARYLTTWGEGEKEGTSEESILHTHTHVSTTHLGSKVRYDDKFLQDIFGEDVGEAGLLDVIRGNIDVVGTQVEVGGRDGPHTPLRL